MEGLKAHHRAGDPLDEAVALFENAIEKLGLSDLDRAPAAGEFQDHVYRLLAGQVGATLVNDDPVRQTVRADRRM